MTFIPGYSGPNYWSGNDFRFGYAMPQPVPRPVPQQPQQQSGLLGAMPQGGVTGYQGGLLGQDWGGVGPSPGTPGAPSGNPSGVGFGTGLGLAGTAIGLGLGAPGLGAVGTGIGTGIDVSNMNTAMSSIGLQPNISFAPAFANNMSFGFMGQSVGNQAANSVANQNNVATSLGLTPELMTVQNQLQQLEAATAPGSVSAIGEPTATGVQGYSDGSVSNPTGVSNTSAAVNDPGQPGVGDGGGGAGGRVICTHMYERGYITRDEIEAERAWARTLPADAIAGYHRWAIPFVAWLSDNDWACPLIAPFVRLWVRGDKSGPFHRLAVGLCRKLAQPAAA